MHLLEKKKSDANYQKHLLKAEFFIVLGKVSNLAHSTELINSSAKAVDELITGLSNDGSLTLAMRLPCLQSILAARDELHSALQSLCSWNQEAEDRSSFGSDKSVVESATSGVRNRVVSKVVYTLPSGASKSSTQLV